jgi:hypothetical protein
MPGQVHIAQQDVRPQPAQHRQGILAALRLAHDLEFGLRAQQHAHACTDHHVVVKHHVADEDVGTEAPQLRQGFLAGFGLPDDLHLRLCAEDQAHARTHHDVVVEHEHPDRHA